MTDYPDPADQREVLEDYKEQAFTAASVGDYVLVKSDKRQGKACFGPTDVMPSHDWKVVMIDWTENQFLLAPDKKRRIDE